MRVLAGFSGHVGCCYVFRLGCVPSLGSLGLGCFLACGMHGRCWGEFHVHSVGPFTWNVISTLCKEHDIPKKKKLVQYYTETEDVNEVEVSTLFIFKSH